MWTAKRGIFGRLAGMLAILVLSTMQQPSAVNATTSEDPDCRGKPECRMCTAEDEEGNYCLVFFCDGGVNWWCWL